MDQFNWPLTTNPLDQLTSVTDPNTHTTAYTINALGERSQLDSPDTGITDYDDYDAAGNLKQQTDAKGQITEYDYDALNRLESITYKNDLGTVEFAVSYTYDQAQDALGNAIYGVGRLTGIQDNTGSTDYHYDPVGRVSKEIRVIGGQTYTTGYDYDSFGRLDQITYPSGRTIDYTFDALGRIESISTTNSGNTQTDTIARNITWQPFGGVNGLTFGDPAGNNESYTRNYDLAGRIDDYTLAESLHTLSYDAASRIQSQSGENIAGPNLAALTETYTPDPSSNRIDSISGSTTVNYAYDNNGSITSDGSLGYVYDARGRLVQVTGTSFGTVSYQTNALGQRVVKTSSLGTTVYHYDTQGRLIAESNSVGTVLREYVYLGMMPVAVIENDTVYFIHSDHLDTPRVVTNSSGIVIWRWVSDPFGKALADNDPDDNGQDFTLNLRFPGQVFDAETGLHYNYFRDYDPGTGRYVQSDPIELEGGLNTYGYVGGNPLLFRDQRGLAAQGLIGCVGGPVGCAVGLGVAAICTYYGIQGTFNALSENASGTSALSDTLPQCPPDPYTAANDDFFDDGDDDGCPPDCNAWRMILNKMFHNIEKMAKTALTEAKIAEVKAWRERFKGEVKRYEKVCGPYKEPPSFDDIYQR